MYQSILQQLTGSLSVVSVPGGANIFIDGEKQTDTTPTIIDILAGHHTYRPSYPGYIDVEGIVNIIEGQTHDLFSTMQKSSIIGDILIYGFVASFTAGITLYLLTRRRDIEG